MPVVNFKLSNGAEMAVNAEDGWTMMEAARKEGVPGIVAECGGGGICSTCHVFILEPWIEKVGPPSALEDMLLEMAPGIDLHLNPDKRTEGRKIGFLICAFDFGEKGAMAYVTTAQPSQLVDAMIELMEKLGATARVVTPNPTKRGQS